MRVTTKELVAKGKIIAGPAAVAGAFALGAALFAGHGSVFAASGAASGSASSPAALMNTASPLDDQSVSALTALDQAMEAVASRVTPAVVNVAVTAKEDGGDQSQLQQIPPQFRQFFGGMLPQQGPQIEHGIGSGVILTPNGYIVTNAHVVDGAVQVKVTLHDRRILPAKVVGVDKLTDLAVIKVDATNLPTIAWGDSTKLKPGQTVLAFGSPFGYLQFSVTRGIVSAVDRPNPFASEDARKPGGYIQTDAAINPGNSGGPLVDSRGELVGINTAIMSASGSFAGAGFAIPSQMVRSVTTQLIAHGKIEHGYLGITIGDVTPENAQFFNVPDARGALVSQVMPDSPASRGGIERGDVIRELNGQKVDTGSALQLDVSQMQPGTPLKLNIIRNGKPMTLNLTVGKYGGNGEEASNSGGAQQKGRIGLSVANLDDQARQQFNVPDNVKGVVVENVRPGSPAEDAGIQPGDVIEEVNRHPAISASEVVNQIHSSPAGKEMLLLVWSHGSASYRTVRPDASGSGDQSGQ